MYVAAGIKGKEGSKVVFIQCVIASLEGLDLDSLSSFIMLGIIEKDQVSFLLLEMFISADGTKWFLLAVQVAFLLIMFLLVMFSFLLTDIESADLIYRRRTLKINEMLRKKNAKIEAKRIAEEEEAAKDKEEEEETEDNENVEKEVEKNVVELASEAATKSVEELFAILESKKKPTE
ncbi:hypothetical protein Tco_0635989 [Tanacetum coccineum]